MSNNHTPGPWHIAWCKSGAHIYDQGTIAVVSDHMIAWKADARLIAAAPDMFVALQEMLSMFKDHRDYGDDEATAVKLALAAINLATKQ